MHMSTTQKTKKMQQRRRAKRAATVRRADHRWSGRVTTESNALDLEPDVFAGSDPHRVALSLKRSAEQSDRRKSEPYRSAMSMLTFYINRAGENLSAKQRRVLEQAKIELRKVFGRA
jgi:hypothetical protein